MFVCRQKELLGLEEQKLKMEEEGQGCEPYFAIFPWLWRSYPTPTA